MQFELNSQGMFVLRGVGAEAWDYIQAERNRLGSPEHWIFGRENFNGTVYITATPFEDKTELVRIMEKFTVKYGMKTNETTVHVYEAWRKEAEFTRENERANKERRAAEKRIGGLKRVIRDGCRGCSYFSTEQDGDDIHGYCNALGKTELEASHLSMEHGEFDRKGVHHLGQKFYPCVNCIWVKYKEERA